MFNVFNILKIGVELQTLKSMIFLGRMFNVFNILKIGVELDDELPSSRIGAWVGPKQSCIKMVEISLLVCTLPLYVQLWPFLSPSSQIQMSPYLFIFFPPPLVWIHSSYLSNFEFNEEWQLRGSISEKTRKFHEGP